ncbi:MAG: helix-turn-helix domain-containing protein [Deltaproteobacteria bacterium]|nr:helix-turn-helix domain-containing protein [Deltaproteobacteria bacterium]
MEKRRVTLTTKFRRRLERRARKERYRRQWQKYQILLKADQGQSPTEISRALHCCRDTVYETIGRFNEYGEVFCFRRNWTFLGFEIAISRTIKGGKSDDQHPETFYAPGEGYHSTVPSPGQACHL